jgi:hypothetical protein
MFLGGPNTEIDWVNKLPMYYLTDRIRDICTTAGKEKEFVKMFGDGLDDKNYVKKFNALIQAEVCSLIMVLELMFVVYNLGVPNGGGHSSLRYEQYVIYYFIIIIIIVVVVVVVVVLVVVVVVLVVVVVVFELPIYLFSQIVCVKLGEDRGYMKLTVHGLKEKMPSILYGDMVSCLIAFPLLSQFLLNRCTFRLAGELKNSLALCIKFARVLCC